MITDIFASHCGPHERIVFCGKVKDAEEVVCVCLEPGLYYGFRFGAPGQPLQVSFSVEDTKVHGDYDWERIDDTDWARLSVSHEGVTYTAWVSRSETNGDRPLGRLEIKGKGDTSLELEPSSIIHDLPID